MGSSSRKKIGKSLVKEIKAIDEEAQHEAKGYLGTNKNKKRGVL